MCRWAPTLGLGMDTPEDIASEEAYAGLVDEISKQAVDEFTSARLRSYYLAHPDLAVGAIALYEEARMLVCVFQPIVDGVSN